MKTCDNSHHNRALDSETKLLTAEERKKRKVKIDESYWHLIRKLKKLKNRFVIHSTRPVTLDRIAVLSNMGVQQELFDMVEHTIERCTIRFKKLKSR